MTQRPNIIVCTCDQLRAFEVGCYGNDVIQTPHVDRLAAEGIRFATAVTNYPVCMAARSVLLSGQYNRACTGGIGNVQFPGRPGDHNMPEYPYAGRPHLKAPTLAELLRSCGYQTSAIGKWHIHSWPHEVGFDHYLIPRVHHCHTGQSFTQDGGPEFVPAGYSVDFEARRVERFLHERRAQAAPFFLYYNISVPHCPLADAPEKYRTMYRPQDIPLRANVDPAAPLKDQDHYFKVYRHDFRYYSLHLPYAETLPAGYGLREVIAEYYGATTWMDAAVGRMLAALDAAGLADNTIVVFTSDHGDNLGSHGLVQKGGPTEESIRIPLIIRGPGLPAAPRANATQVASLVDIAPTLLSLAGADRPAHLHGRDLTLALGAAPAVAARHDADSIAADSCAFIETRAGVAIRTVQHMYFLPYVTPGSADPDHALADKPTQFFDLADDPYQLRNLAATGEQIDDARPLDAALRHWHATTPWMAK